MNCKYIANKGCDMKVMTNGQNERQERAER
jgi:hypothetical protein